MSTRVAITIWASCNLHPQKPEPGCRRCACALDVCQMNSSGYVLVAEAAA